MAPEGCLFTHPPSARARAALGSAAELTTQWHCKLPLKLSLSENTPCRPMGARGQKRGMTLHRRQYHSRWQPASWSRVGELASPQKRKEYARVARVGKCVMHWSDG